jgi:hypothetical protein
MTHYLSNNKNSDAYNQHVCLAVWSKWKMTRKAPTHHCSHWAMPRFATPTEWMNEWLVSISGMPVKLIRKRYSSIRSPSCRLKLDIQMTCVFSNNVWKPIKRIVKVNCYTRRGLLVPTDGLSWPKSQSDYNRRWFSNLQGLRNKPSQFDS